MRKQTQPYKVKILEVATIIPLLVLIIVIDIAIIIWVVYSLSRAGIARSK